MNLGKLRLNIFEKAILIAIFLNLFSFWPTYTINQSEKSGFELAMLSGLLLCIFTIYKVGLKTLLQSIYTLTWRPLALWFVYGSTLTLILTSTPEINILRIGYLLTVMLASYCVYFLIKTKKANPQIILTGWVALAILITPILLTQFLIASIYQDTFIRDIYGVGTFQFPRIHGFSFEPLFLANWLIAPLLYLYYSIWKSPSTKNFIYTVMVSSVFFLTLSRGAFIALAATLIILALLNLKEVRSLIYPSTSVLVGLLISLFFVGAASSINNSSFQNGVGRFLDHSTLGIFNSEGAGNVKPDKVTSTNGETKETFVNIQGIDNKGVVEGSTEGRIESNKSALNIFTDNFSNAIFGIGLFRFGEVANSNEPEIFSSSKQLTNNQWLDIFVETGILGAALIIYFIHVNKAQIFKSHQLYKLLILCLSIQFLTFSGYFLMPFWVCLGILLGSNNRIGKP